MKKFYGILFLLIIFLGVGMLNFKAKLERDLQSLDFTDISMKHAKEGIYRGECSLGPVNVETEVIVEQGKIESVHLLRHDNGMGGPAEILPFLMQQDNTWDVDIVTGATISSQAIRQAVNRALAESCK